MPVVILSHSQLANQLVSSCTLRRSLVVTSSSHLYQCYWLRRLLGAWFVNPSPTHKLRCPSHYPFSTITGVLLKLRCVRSDPRELRVTSLPDAQRYCTREWEGLKTYIQARNS